MKSLFVILLLLFTALPSFSSGHGQSDSSRIAHELRQVLADCRRSYNEASCLRQGVRSVVNEIEYSNSVSNQCAGVNINGKWAAGGGCNINGCWYPGGGCNINGCWYAGGSCNINGCVKEAPPTDKACQD